MDPGYLLHNSDCCCVNAVGQKTSHNSGTAHYGGSKERTLVGFCLKCFMQQMLLVNL